MDFLFPTTSRLIRGSPTQIGIHDIDYTFRMPKGDNHGENNKAVIE